VAGIAQSTLADVLRGRDTFRFGQKTVRTVGRAILEMAVPEARPHVVEFYSNLKHHQTTYRSRIKPVPDQQQTDSKPTAN